MNIMNITVQQLRTGERVIKHAMNVRLNGQALEAQFRYTQQRLQELQELVAALRNHIRLLDAARVASVGGGELIGAGQIGDYRATLERHEREAERLQHAVEVFEEMLDSGKGA